MVRRSSALQSVRQQIKKATLGGGDPLKTLNNNQALKQASIELGRSIDHLERLMVRYAIRLSLAHGGTGTTGSGSHWAGAALQFGYSVPPTPWTAGDQQLVKRLKWALARGAADIDSTCQKLLLLTQGKKSEVPWVTVAVMDDGINANKAFALYDERPSSELVDHEGNWSGKLAAHHGSQVASVVTSQQLKVRLLDVPIFASNNPSVLSPARLVERVEAAVAGGATVINISAAFGPEYAGALTELFAKHPEVLFVFAAGNALPAAKLGPSSDDAAVRNAKLGRLIDERGIKNALLVGAHNIDGQLADFSASGEYVDVAAWGVRLVVPNTKSGELQLGNGTSFSAPRVSRLAVQMLQLLGPASQHLVGGVGAGLSSIIKLASQTPASRFQDGAQVPRLDERMALKIAAYIRLRCTGREGSPPSESQAQRWVSLPPSVRAAVDNLCT